MMRIRDNAESVALMNGAPYEQAVLGRFYETVVARWMAIVWQHGHLTWITNASGPMIPIVPLLFAAPKYISGELSLGQVTQLAAAFVQVQIAISWVVDNYNRVAEWYASARRVMDIVDACDAIDAETAKEPPAAVQPATARGGNVRLSEFEITDGSGRPLLEGADLAAAPGEAVHIHGDSSTGKSTLVRVLAGLWPAARGRLSIPDRADVMITPQKSYLPLGSLRGALLYPDPSLQVANDRLEAALGKVGLSALGPRLDEVARWDQVLSNGERQRLGIARLLIHQPRVVILDDALSALEESAQAAVLARLRASFPTPPSSAWRSARLPPACTIASWRWSAAPTVPPSSARPRRCWRPPSSRHCKKREGSQSLSVMTKLNYWNETWSLDEAQCPCDVHFVEYLEGKKAKDAAIFHFGTGNHHIVGLKLAAERLQLRRARHHRLAAGVRRLRRAADPEPASRPHLQGLLRRHLPARCPPAAAVRLREPVPRRRVPHARERRLRRAHRPGDDADAGRQGQARRRDPVLFGLVRLRQGRGRGQGARAPARPFEPADAFKSCASSGSGRAEATMSIWSIYKRALAMLVVERRQTVGVVLSGIALGIVPIAEQVLLARVVDALALGQGAFPIIGLWAVLGLHRHRRRRDRGGDGRPARAPPAPRRAGPGLRARHRPADQLPRREGIGRGGAHHPGRHRRAVLELAVVPARAVRGASSASSCWCRPRST